MDESRVRRTFSLATLLLVMAIAAVALASIRSLLVRVWNGESEALILPMVAGAIGGALVGLALAIWNRGSWRLANLRGWPWTITSTIGGMGIGAAVGAQTTAGVDWSVIVLSPLVVIGTAALVAINRRRQIRLVASRPAVRSAIEPRPSPIQPSTSNQPVLADETQ